MALTFHQIYLLRNYSFFLGTTGILLGLKLILGKNFWLIIKSAPWKYASKSEKDIWRNNVYAFQTKNKLRKILAYVLFITSILFLILGMITAEMLSK